MSHPPERDTRVTPGTAGSDPLDWLDAALRNDGHGHRAAYVGDGGFTARVMSALPAPAALPAWRKPALAALWGTAGYAIATLLPGAYADVVRELFRVVGGHPVSLTDIATGVAMLGVATWAATAYALRSD